MRSQLRVRLVGALLTAAAGVPGAATAGARQGTEAGGFTEAQIALGRAVYAGACAECHGAALEGGSHGPALTGVAFESRWGGRTAAELLEYLREEMPPGLGGTLSEDAYHGLVALVIQSNGGAAGGVPPTAVEAPGRSGGGDRGGAGPGRGRGRRRADDTLRPSPHAGPGRRHRRAASGSPARRLAELAPDPRQPRVQPPRPDRPRHRR